MTRGTTLYLRGLPEALVREAKATAARRGVTLAALVAQALQQAVGVPVPLPGSGRAGRARPGASGRPGSSGRPGGSGRAGAASREGAGTGGAAADATERLTESMRWFEANRHRLLRRYRSRYVAIDRGRVIDHDRDFDALARRVFARLGPRPVFMPKVTADERVVSVPSPRLVQA
ncbi:MAG: hypothetical protein QN131_04955 [Armatimonadota bacterium]|nr:hypothetical protein [Armatimonadota bacterium]MDR7549274.1 hypothetical protein [Armatimonadota bacterium]